MMRDFKHIVSKKKIRFPFFGGSGPASAPLLYEPRRRKRFLRIALPLIALLLAALPVRSVIRENQTIAKEKARPEYLKALDANQSLRLCADSLKGCRVADGKLSASLPDGGSVVFSIDPDLQERVRKVMVDNGVPYGAFVAIEPKTGRILAMEAYSAIDPRWNDRACFGLYPMASLFKMVTAAAAFEQRKA